MPGTTSALWASFIRLSQRAVPRPADDASRSAFVVSSSPASHECDQGEPPSVSAHLRFRHGPALAHLLGRDDVPRKEHHLPRPLTPEQDQLIQQELLRRSGLLSNALLLLRHTGMRIGECVDLSVDCLRPLGPNQWAIHVPLGKLKTKRWVPVDSMVCQLVERIRFLRPPTAIQDRSFAIVSAARPQNVGS